MTALPSDYVLVTGAAGGLGRALATQLARDHAAAVVGVGLHPAPADVPLAGHVVADIADIEWQELVARSRGVFHLAAFVHRRPVPAEIEYVHSVNHRATARLASACRTAGVPLLFASTVSVFGPPGAQVIGDTHPPSPHTEYGRSKLLAEDAIRGEGANGLEYTILRLPLLYGPHGRGNMEKMLRAIRNRRYWPVGDPGVAKSCLHFSDAARAFTLAWRASERAAATYIVAPETAPTMREIHAAAYRALDMAPPKFAIPAAAASVAAAIVDGALKALGRPARFREQIATLTSAAHYDGSRFASSVGFRANVSLAEGMADTVRWLRDTPRA